MYSVANYQKLGMTDNSKQPNRSQTYKRIYAVVKRIPKGRVATYGQIAALAGSPKNARQVGYALHALPDEYDIPWHRVINAQGAVSLRKHPGYDRLQHDLLRREGVEFTSAGVVDLRRYQWEPR